MHATTTKKNPGRYEVRSGFGAPERFRAVTKAKAYARAATKGRRTPAWVFDRRFEMVVCAAARGRLHDVNPLWTATRG